MLIVNQLLFFIGKVQGIVEQQKQREVSNKKNFNFSPPDGLERAT